MTTTEIMLPNQWQRDNSNNETKRKMLLKEQEANIMQELFNIANKELRENEIVRRQCLAHLREWIKQNADIENCLTDDIFLLRFLRVKKFSIPMAEQTLLKYLNYRKKFRNIMYDLDYTDPKVNELINTGYIFVSPFRDSHGRRVIIYDISKFDLQKYNCTDMSRAHVITYETLLEDEENQILGVNHVGDVRALTPPFATLFPVTEVGYLIKWGEQSVPMRHKEINLLNLPSALKYIYEVAKSFMSQKLKDRIMIHNSKEQLIKKVGKQCLPLEFGGEMPAIEMVQMWKEELAAKRKRLLSFNSMNLLSDRGIIRTKDAPRDGNQSLPGSFRKLELD